MSFGETFFIIIGSVIAGLILSLGIIYIIARIQKKPMLPSTKQKRTIDTGSLPRQANVPTAVRPAVAVHEGKLEELYRNHKKPENNSTKLESGKVQNNTSKPDNLPKSEPKPVMAKASPPPMASQKPEVSKKSQETEAVKKQSRSPKPDVQKQVKPHPATITPSITPTENKREELLKNLKQAEVPKTQAQSPGTQSQSPKSEMYKELESNLSIATAPWASKLTPFQTTCWDGDYLKDDPSLIASQEEIAQVYIDIRLANSIVWLSNEVGHRSSDLDQSYKQLCVKIAERLKQVIVSPEGVI